MSVYRPNRSPYFHFDFQFKGKRHHGSTGCTSKRAAEQYEARERQKAALPSQELDPITLDEACSLYQDRTETKRSWRTVKQMLVALLAIGRSRYLADIGQIDLMRHFARRRDGRKDSSVNREIEVARAVWKIAEEAGRAVGKMPTWGKLFYAVPDQPPRELSFDEQDRLMPALRGDIADVCLFAIQSGWRKSEVLGLRWSDIDFPNSVAKTRIKGGDVRQRALTQSMSLLIANQPRVGPFVFTYVCQKSKSRYTDKWGRVQPARRKDDRYPMTATVLRKPWAAAKVAAEIEGLRFHDLRHTTGTRIVRATGNLAAAKKALEHSSIKTTLRYAHVLTDDVRNALDAAESRNSPEQRGEGAGIVAEKRA